MVCQNMPWAPQLHVRMLMRHLCSRHLHAQDSDEQACFICGKGDMSLHLLAACCVHAQRSHWNAAQMRFLQSRSRRCCLLKWVQTGLKWCVQPAEASFILAIRMDCLQVSRRQCSKDSILLDISSMHEYSQRDCRSRPVRRRRGLARRPVRQSHCCARQRRSGHRCLCCQRWMAQRDLQMLCSLGRRLALTGCKLAPYVKSAFS